MAMPDIKERIATIGLIPTDTPSIDGMRSYVKASGRSGERW